MCVHARSCPGCPWIERSYAQQLEDKADFVAETVLPFHELSGLTVQPVRHTGKSLGYRVRAKLVSDASGALGLFARGTHDVVDIPECVVLDPLVAEGARALRAGLRALPVLEGADIARVDDALMVTLIAAQHASDAALRQLAESVRSACPSIKSLAVSRRAHGAVQLLGGHVERLSGPAELKRHLRAGGPYHYATFGAFMQTHPDVAAAIYGAVRERVFAQAGPRPRVLELYAGSGALALELAAAGAEVVAVEAFGPSCERLARAAREQQLPLEVLHGDAGELSRMLVQSGRSFDVVIVNPPRRGLDAEARRAVLELAPRHVAYVSCHPPTLSRDLAHLAREGYAAEPLAPFDMMPFTEHVETLAWLSARTVAAPKVLFEHPHFVAVLKGPHEPTTPQGEHASSLLLRVQRLPGWAEAVPVHRLDVGTSGVVLFARTAAHVHGLSQALAAGEKTYLALAQGIVRAQGRIQKPIIEQGRSLAASTRYKRSEVVAGHSLLRVLLETGRKHQIRRHLAGIGHPLVGDARYGERRTNQHFTMRHGLDRPFLHCTSVVITYEGERIEIHTPLAPDLALVLRSMRDDAPERRKPSESLVVPAVSPRAANDR